MSGKFAQKNNKKKSNPKRAALWAVIVVLSLVLSAALLLWWGLYSTENVDDPSDSQTESTPRTAQTTQPTQTPQPEQTIQMVEIKEISKDLGQGLFLADVGKYTGIFMEDGTDEVVSGVLMMVVKNTGEETIQYAELTVETSAGTAEFSLSTLPAGASVVLLEQNRMQWSAEEDYSSVTVDNVAVFAEELSLCEDQISLQVMDGAINVTNISGADITGDIVIYYKNSVQDIYYGGITYRVRIQGGLKAEEVRQIMGSHFSDTGSTILFVTVG